MNENNVSDMPNADTYPWRSIRDRPVVDGATGPQEIDEARVTQQPERIMMTMHRMPKKSLLSVVTEFIKRMMKR